MKIDKIRNLCNLALVHRCKLSLSLDISALLYNAHDWGWSPNAQSLHCIHLEVKTGYFVGRLF